MISKVMTSKLWFIEYKIIFMDDVRLIPDVGASARRGAKRRAREQEILPFLPRGRAKALGAARPSGHLCSYQPTPHRHMLLVGSST